MIIPPPLTSQVRATRKRLHHVMQTRNLQAYLRWRNANACHPDMLPARHRERGRAEARNSAVGDYPLTEPLDHPTTRRTFMDAALVPTSPAAAFLRAAGTS
jgi:hypothetical protein